MTETRSIRVVDSHTEGEPTRVVIDGWPQPQGHTMAERLEDARAHSDHLRTAVVCEPRGLGHVKEVGPAGNSWTVDGENDLA